MECVKQFLLCCPKHCVSDAYCESLAQNRNHSDSGIAANSDDCVMFLMHRWLSAKGFAPHLWSIILIYIKTSFSVCIINSVTNPTNNWKPSRKSFNECFIIIAIICPKLNSPRYFRIISCFIIRKYLLIYSFIRSLFNFYSCYCLKRLI